VLAIKRRSLDRYTLGPWDYYWLAAGLREIEGSVGWIIISTMPAAAAATPYFGIYIIIYEFCDDIYIWAKKCENI